MRRFDVAPVPAQGFFELMVPPVKDDGREWGINFEFVVGGKMLGAFRPLSEFDVREILRLACRS